MSNLCVRLFGRFSARYGDQILHDLDVAKVQALFAYLLLYRDRPHSREALAGVLWGEHATGQSRKYLRQALWQLQRSLAAHTGLSHDRFLVVEPDWVRLNGNADLWLDVAEFEKAYRLTQSIPLELLREENARLLQSAAELYEGALLESCYEDWCLFERERLQNMRLSALDKLMGYCELQHEYNLGKGYAEQILRCDPARERTHRRLMRLLYLEGDRAGALRQYERCVAILDTELAVKPARSTVALVEQIRADRLDGFERGRADVIWNTEPVTGSDSVAALEQLRSELREIERRVQQGIRFVDLALDDRP